MKKKTYFYKISIHKTFFNYMIYENWEFIDICSKCILFNTINVDDFSVIRIQNGILRITYNGCTNWKINLNDKDYEYKDFR